MKKVSIVVLGDVGRSPRMQNHALSLAKEGYLVNVIGYSGSEPYVSLSTHSNVKFVYLIDCPDFKEYLSTKLAYVLKALWQAVTLLIALVLGGIPDYILVQNPPAIPSLGVCYIYSRLTWSQFIIDWHNYGYSILAIGIGPDARLVQICKWFEFFMGRRSDQSICVTRAMKDDLLKKHRIRATTLYDRAPDSFRPLSLEEKHSLFRSLGQDYKVFVRDCSGQDTIFTMINDEGKLELKVDRPGLLISSTSWTEDEDFSLLLEGLQDYEDAKNEGRLLPRLLLVITGKGPLQEFYVEVMSKRNWEHIDVITPWLPAEDYPKLLACADLGVCLHYSSSGLDLPMKVVDMFGCGLPVCAVKFACLDELVLHEKNGMVFQDATELGKQIQMWFKGFPDGIENPAWRKEIQDTLKTFQDLRWHENWMLHVKHIFR